MTLSTTLHALLQLSCGTLPSSYPQEWWAPVPETEKASWEILPQEAQEGEVILSKRTELGVFSNFAPTSFELDGVVYASLEGFWQMMKYPDPLDPQDPRHQLVGWTYTRAQVAQLTAWEAKRAGDHANTLNHAAHIEWMSYQGERFFPKDHGVGSQRHHQLIERATWKKITQNPEVAELLLKTRGLKLHMDHDLSAQPWPAYQTPQILMSLRERLCGKDPI